MTPCQAALPIGMLVFLWLWCVGPRRTQRRRLVQGNMAQLRGGALRVGEQQHADAPLHALTRHGNLAGAEQGRIGPAELAGGEGRILGVQVIADREKDTGDVFHRHRVALDDTPQQLARGTQNLIAGVGADSRCAADASTGDQCRLLSSYVTKEKSRGVCLCSALRRSGSGAWFAA